MKDLSKNNIYAKRKLTGMALVRFISAFLILSIILFLSAGSFGYVNAWLFLGELIILMAFAFIYLIKHDPELLQKRLNTRETEKKQKKVILLTLVTVFSVFIISGLDYRFHWTIVPLWLVVLSAIIVFVGYLLFYIVIRQNSYASRIIEIQKKQKVIDTGLYAVVRHPMYLAVIMMYLFIPLLLGSFYAFILMLLFPFQIIMRIKNEEEVLEKGLEGYIDYKKRVKYKVIPFIW